MAKSKDKVASNFRRTFSQEFKKATVQKMVDGHSALAFFKESAIRFVDRLNET